MFNVILISMCVLFGWTFAGGMFFVMLFSLIGFEKYFSLSNYQRIAVAILSGPIVAATDFESDGECWQVVWNDVKSLIEKLKNLIGKAVEGNL